MKPKIVDISIAASLFFITFLFFGNVLFPEGEEIISGPDITFLFKPILSFTFSAFQGGRIPLWNPYLFLGFPQYAEPQFSTFYPMVWVLSVLSVAKAISWLYAIHFGLTAVGGYVFARQLKVSWGGGVLTAFVLTFSAFMVTHLYGGHLPHIMTITYLPWLLAAAVWAVKSRTAWRTIAATMIAAVPLALAMLAGYAPFFPFLVAAVSLLMFWLAWQESGRRAAARITVQWAGLGLFAGLLAAVQLLPTIQFTLLSSRAANANYAFANSLAMPFGNWLTLFMPDLFGAPVGDVPYWSNAPIYFYWESAVYVGILPLLFFILAWPLGRRSWRFWIIAGAIALIVALGANGGLHLLLYQIMPGFRLFRVPPRIAYFFVLAVAMVSGLMLDRWLELPEEIFQVWRERLRRILIGSLAILLFLVVIAVLWQAAQVDTSVAVRIGGIVNQLVRLAFLLAASLIFLIWCRGQAYRRIVLVMALLLLIDYWGYGAKFITLTTDEEVDWKMADAALPGERSAYRILTSVLSPNSGLPYGFYNVDGYDDFRTETGQKLAEMASWDARMIRLLGARYLLYGPDREKTPVTGGWELLGQPAGVTIYERSDISPKAFVVHQVIPAADQDEAWQVMQQPQHDWAQTAVVQVMPGTECSISPGDPAADKVQVTIYEPERVVLKTDTAAAGWLVLNDLYYPGWQADVDGITATIQPTNYGLRGICLPVGRHEVTFRFQPQIFYVGRLISGIAWLLLGGAALFFVWMGRKEKTAGV